MARWSSTNASSLCLVAIHDSGGPSTFFCPVALIGSQVAPFSRSVGPQEPRCPHRQFSGTQRDNITREPPHNACGSGGGGNRGLGGGGRCPHNAGFPLTKSQD